MSKSGVKTGGEAGAEAEQGSALADLAAVMGEAVEVLAAGQAMGLALLKAEMEALTQVLPATEEDAEAAEARLRAEEAAREDGFDNMPV